MKRLITLFAAIVFAGQAWAEDFVVGDLAYTITDTVKHEVSVSAANDSITGDIKIPSNVEKDGVTYNVTSISKFAFDECKNITSITISNYITCIGSYAFESCENLKFVNIPNSVARIGANTFSDCKKLTSINIPNSVTEIGFTAFENCSNLKEINVAGDNPVYASEKGVLFDKNKTILICFPAGKKGSYTIPYKVEIILDFAFSGCKGLTAVKIPKSVTNIGNSAFSDCSGLTSVTIPNSVINIGSNAFCDCKGLVSVIIGNSVTNIGIQAFYGCDNLSKADFVSIQHLCSIIFGRLGNVSSSAVTITPMSDDVELIPITIPNYIMRTANPLLYAHHLFVNGKEITDLTIPASVKNIGNFTFVGCSNLSSVTISDSVSFIGEGAFWGCSKLTSIIIPDGVETIGDGAFCDCSELKSVSIPKSVTSVGEDAFKGCKFEYKE